MHHTHHHIHSNHHHFHHHHRHFFYHHHYRNENYTPRGAKAISIISFFVFLIFMSLSIFFITKIISGSWPFFILPIIIIIALFTFIGSIISVTNIVRFSKAIDEEKNNKVEEEDN